MGDLLNGLISFALSTVLAVQPNEIRITAKALVILLGIILWTLFVYRPLASRLRSAEHGTVDRDLGYGWIVTFVLIGGGPWLGFEIWPSVLLCILIVRAMENRTIGLFKKIPGYRSVLTYSHYMHLACIASYRLSVQHNDGDGWWRRFIREGKEAVTSSGSRNDTVVTLVIGMAISNFWMVFGVVMLFQPLGTLISGGTAADIPTDIYCSLGAGMFCQYTILSAVLMIVFEAFRYGHYGNNKPRAVSEVSQAREKLKTLRETMGGWGKLFLKATFVAVVGGGGFAIQGLRIFSRPLGISLRLQDILKYVLSK